MVVNTETDNLYSFREEQSKWEFFAKIFKRKLECLSKHRNKISSGAIYEKHAAHLRRDSHAWNFNGIRSRSDTITGITLVRIGRKASLSIDDLINKCLFHFFFSFSLSRYFNSENGTFDSEYILRYCLRYYNTILHRHSKYYA